LALAVAGFVAAEDMIDRDERLPCDADYGSLASASRGDALGQEDGEKVTIYLMSRVLAYNANQVP